MGVAEKTAAPLPAKLAGLVREAKWLVLVALALYLLLVFSTFHRADPGWSHSATDAAVRNAGGLVGALVSAGTSDDHAHVYSESVRRGGTLVSVRAEDADAAAVESILDSHGPIDPVARGAEYRSSGWTTFDPKAPPYKPSETEIERMRRARAA